MINYYEPKLDLTLLGCGFLGSYHLGAIYLLKQIWPDRAYERISGASCGGLLGALLIAGLHLDSVLDSAMNIMRRLRQFLRNPFQQKYLSMISLIEQRLEKLLPDDAHLRCTNKLGISVTKVDWLVPNLLPLKMDNQLISEFRSRRDLIDSICAGCFIPLWSGFAFGHPFRQGIYIDGAYSDNKPRFEIIQNQQQKQRTSDHYQVELSPFSGDTEVSPPDESYLFKMSVMGSYYMVNWQNVIRTTHAMIPFRLDKYRTYLIGGHRDMKEFLFKNNLIKCPQCYLKHDSGESLSLTSSVTANGADKQQHCFDRRQQQYNACLFCLRLLEKVDSLKLSPKFIQLMSE